MKIFPLFCLAILLLCCRTTKEEIEKEFKNSVEIISIPSSFDQKILASELVDSVYYIPLETPKSHFIGTINKLVVTDNRIFVLDVLDAKSLFVFNKNGKFLFEINAIGKGPGEFIKPCDFLLDPKLQLIEILDRESQNILTYDWNGNYLRKIHYGLYVHEFQRSKQNDYIFHVNNRLNSIEEKDTLSKYGDLPYNILVYNKDKGIISKHLPYSKDKGLLTFSLPNIFYSFKDSISVIPVFSDTLYRIANKKIFSRYFIDFGKYKLPRSHIPSEEDFQLFLKNVFNSEYAFFPKSFCETPNALQFAFTYKEKSRVVFYSKISKEVKTAYEVVDDLDTNLSLAPIAKASYKNLLVGALWPNELKEKFEAKRQKLSNQEWENFCKENNKSYDLYLSIKDIDNPILMFYELKDF